MQPAAATRGPRATRRRMAGGKQPVALSRGQGWWLQGRRGCRQPSIPGRRRPDAPHALPMPAGALLRAFQCASEADELPPELRAAPEAQRESGSTPADGSAPPPPSAREGWLSVRPMHARRCAPCPSGRTTRCRWCAARTRCAPPPIGRMGPHPGMHPPPGGPCPASRRRQQPGMRLTAHEAHGQAGWSTAQLQPVSRPAGKRRQGVAERRGRASPALCPPPSTGP